MIVRFLRRGVAGLVAAAGLGLAPPAFATVYSTDFTDMWWNAAEDGWGMNIIQQGDILFATFFIYGPDQSPRWYVASSLAPQSAPAGTYVFGGKLYATTGPWFGGTFNPANVGVTEAGGVTISFSSPGTASLTYNVGATVVSKSLTRLSWRIANPAGRFLGGLTFSASPCANPNNQGNAYIQGVVTTTLNGSQVSFRIDYITPGGSAAACTLAGNLVQQGRLSAVTGGTWSCASGGTVSNQGSFTLGAIDVQVNGFNAAWSASDQFCQYNGRFGGVRDVVN